MKKIFKLLLIFIFSMSLWAESDVSLYNDLSSAYSSGFYPGVVEYASKLLEKYPDSPLKIKTIAQKGECLARLGFTKEAKPVLEQAISLIETDFSLKNQCRFWLAKVYEAENQFNEALHLYYNFLLFEKDENGGEKIFNSAFFESVSASAKKTAGYILESIYCAAKIYRKLDEYKKSIELLEFVVKNGKFYSKSTFAHSFLMLCDSYNKINEPEKTIFLYEKLLEKKEKNDSGDFVLNDENFYSVVQYACDAYYLKKDYRKAYELSCQVLASGQKALAASALKKAYGISSLHRKEVGMEPGTVLSQAQETLKDKPDLLGEFWTRLGIDSYEDGNYQKAVLYFNEAKKYPFDKNLEMANLYESQIKFGKNPSKESAYNAENHILKYRKGREKLFYEREGNILLVKYLAVMERWDELKKLALSIVPSEKSVSYYYGMACYKTADFSAAVKTFETDENEIKALSLAKQQRLREAAAVFEKLKESRVLSDVEMLDYAKILLISGRYRESQIIAAKCSFNEAKYILALAQFNTWSWPYAEENFEIFLKNGGKTDVSTQSNTGKDFSSYARFYLGYSQYRQGKNEKAVSNLEIFTNQNPSHELIWNGYMTAANACVQLGKYSQAVSYAEKAIKKSGSQNRQDAVLLCASIYKDAKQFDKAITLLEPYSKLNNDFGMNALYAMARIYEEVEDFDTADLIYKKVVSSFSGKNLSEEAMYRRAEMFYKARIYDSALERFGIYSAKNPNGKYLDASWYYTADCLVKKQKTNRAILQFQALIKKFPSSPYVYDSAKKLVEMNRTEGKYSDALEYCALLLSRFGKQAEDEGFREESIEIEKLISGSTEEIVRMETRYKKAGESETSEGRHVGTLLCSLYVKHPNYEHKAFSLAEKLLSIQEKYIASECLDASNNALLIANAYRSSGKNEKAANKYLDAAKYCKMAGNPEGNAQIALYSAYDAFLAAGKAGDARATALNLRKLYPDSVQAKQVKID